MTMLQVNKLRIAIIKNNLPENGGASSFETGFIKTLKNIQNENLHFEILYSEFESNRFKENGLNSRENKIVRVNFLIKIKIMLEMSLLLSSLLNRFAIFETKFERKLKKDFDAVIFLSPNPLALLVKTTPMVTTVWDIGHRELPYLPEFQLNNNFKEREFYFQQTIPRSMVILVDSEKTKKSITEVYGVKSDRVLVTGLFPQNPNAHALLSEKSSKCSYIFYPANYWMHKNHLRLLDAFKDIREKHPNCKLFMTGADKGSLGVVRKYVEELGLKDDVKFLEFVSRDQYWEKLSSSEGLVFPTLLGPTNLPPLEANILGKKMAISDFHRSQFDGLSNTENIVYFDPHSVESIKTAIFKMLSLSDNDGNDFSEINNLNMTAFLKLLTTLLPSHFLN